MNNEEKITDVFVKASIGGNEIELQNVNESTAMAIVTKFLEVVEKKVKDLKHEVSTKVKAKQHNLAELRLYNHVITTLNQDECDEIQRLLITATREDLVLRTAIIVARKLNKVEFYPSIFELSQIVSTMLNNSATYVHKILSAKQREFEIWKMRDFNENDRLYRKEKFNKILRRAQLICGEN